MRNYSKLIAGTFCALAFFVTTAFATTNEQASLYNAGELGFSIGTGYAFTPSALFKNAYDFNLTAGAFYFPYRNFGAEVNVPFYQTKGASVSEVQAGLLARLPVTTNVPLLRNFAPYIGLGGVYAWNVPSKWAYIAKAGVDLRLNSKWSVFTEYQYRNVNFYWSQGEQRVQGGIHLVF